MQTWRASLTNCAEIINHSNGNIMHLKQPADHLMNNAVTDKYCISVCLQDMPYIGFSQDHFSVSQEK
jgi:hypothetical protein